MGSLATVALALAGRARVRPPEVSLVGAAAPASANTGAAAGGEPCSTNAECIERNGGQAYACRHADHQCISLLSEDCPRYLGDKQDLRNEAAIYLGLLVTKDVNGAQGEAAVEMARSELKLTLGGGVRTSTASPARPLVIVACDTDLNHPLGAARHLIQDVRVTALLGGYVSSNILSIAQEYTIPAGVLHIAPSATADPISDLVDHDLVYRAQVPGSIIFQALTPFIEQIIQPAIHARGTAIPGQPLRALLLHSGDGSGVYQAQSILNTLRINGKPAAENAEDLFRVINLGDANDSVNNPNPSARYAEVLSATFALRPQLIIFQAAEAFTPVLATMERLWPQELPKPYYITASALTAQLPAFVGTDAALRRRTFAFMSLPDEFNPMDFTNWALTLSSRSQDLMKPTQAISHVHGPNLYDSMYMLAYAISTLGDREPTGSNLVPGFRRLGGPGRRVKFGPAELPGAMGDLAAGKDIDYIGINGAFRYTRQGDRTGLAALACVTIDAAGRAIGTKASGFVYDARTKRTVSAALECP